MATLRYRLRFMAQLGITQMRNAHYLLSLSVIFCFAGQAMAASTGIPTVARSASMRADSANKSKTVTIFSNLAAQYPKGLYFVGIYSAIYGQNGAGTGQSEAVAAGFTPAADATATQLALALTWSGENGKMVTISLDSDNAGVPGPTLWSEDIKITTVTGQCCGLLKVDITGGLALKGGTPYWLAVTADKPSEVNSFVQWAPEWIEPSVPIPQISSGNDGTGWATTRNNGQSAFAVLGE